MITVLEAQKLIEHRVALLTTEAVALAQAHGRVLREAVASTEDLPPFDRSAMDGYAVRVDDGADEFAVVGEIRAGEAVDRELRPGEAVRIFTGARLPGAGLKVVMQEHVEVREGRMKIVKESSASNVRQKGEDAKAGEILLEPGITLDATAVALLASLGKTSIAVSKCPTILHITTGDEVVPPDCTPKPGQVRNSNASLIAGLCREAGLDSVSHFHAGDDLKTMLDLFAKAKAETYDMVLVSGGSGGGMYDHTAKLFQEKGGAIHFREINVRPGKPLIFGTALREQGAQILFGLPGNALSHFVCFHLFVRGALDRMAGRSSATTTTGFLAEAMSETQNARETWWPARASMKEGRLECRALPWKSSGDITRLPSANALIKVPASTSHLPAGTMVEILLTRDIFP